MNEPSVHYKTFIQKSKEVWDQLPREKQDKSINVQSELVQRWIDTVAPSFDSLPPSQVVVSYRVGVVPWFAAEHNELLSGRALITQAVQTFIKTTDRDKAKVQRMVVASLLRARKRRKEVAAAITLPQAHQALMAGQFNAQMFFLEDVPPALRTRVLPPQ